MPNCTYMPSFTDNQNEYFDTFTVSGEKLAPQKRGHVHANGIWHRAVNVMLYRSNGDLVLQQRAATKRVCPLAWDLSVAEHLQVGEGWQAAAHRGLAEELGITNVTLTQWGPEIQERHEIPERGIRNYEFQRCFKGRSDAYLCIDPEEVAAVRDLSPTDFHAEVEHAPDSFTPWLLEWARRLDLLP